MADINKIKNHPGFMPFGCANISSDSSETQSQRDKDISKKESKIDNNKEK